MRSALLLMFSGRTPANAMDQPFSQSSHEDRSGPPGAREAVPDDALQHRRVGTVLRELAHEFGNLLFPLQMILELQDHAAPLSPQELSQILRGHISEVSTLAARFRWMGRCLSGGLEPSFTTVDCEELVRAAVELCRLPRTAGHAFTIDLSAAGGPIHGDRDLLSQALAELIENAVRFTPTHGTIAVTAHRHAGDVEFIVSDDGPGIAPELRAQVFEPFSFGTPKLDLASGQLGCGLALATCIAGVHRGTVALRSCSQQGSQFSLRIAADRAH